MPWKLTKPVDTGDLDAVNYGEIKLSDQRWLSQPYGDSILVSWQYGNTVDGKWVPGHAPTGKETSRHIAEEEYTALVSHISNDGEPTYVAVKRGLYEHLASVGAIEPGVMT